MKTQRNAINRDDRSRIRYRVAQILWCNDYYAINVLHRDDGSMREGQIAVVHRNTGLMILNCDIMWFHVLTRIAENFTQKFPAIARLRNLHKESILSHRQRRYAQRCADRYQRFLDNLTWKQS